MAYPTVNSVNMDERTSPRAELTQSDVETATIFANLKLRVLVSVIVLVFVAAGILLGIQLPKHSPAPGSSHTGFTAKPPKPPTPPTPPTPRPTCTAEQCNKSAAIILSSMDKTQDPCHNFFEYACGGWNRRQEIPNYSLEITKFSELDDDLQSKLKDLIERDPQHGEPVSFSKVRNFYNACIDLDTINGLGAEPLTNILQSLGGWPVLGLSPGGNWQQEFYHFERLFAILSSQYNVHAILSTGVSINQENTGQYILQIDFPDFKVPLSFRSDRQKRVSSLIPESLSTDFGRHLLLSEGLEEKRAAYLRYMVDIALALGGDPSDVDSDMMDVLEFEKTLAQYAEDALGNAFDESKTDTLGLLSSSYDEVDWTSLYQHLLPPSVHPSVSQFENIVVQSPQYLAHVNLLLPLTEPRVVTNYMIWKLVNKMVPYLGDEYLVIYHNYLMTLRGLSAPPDRWKLCTDQVNTVLPFATGRMYVDEHFSADTKTKTEGMVRQLRKALRDMFWSVTWLSSTDARKSQQKLDAMSVSVGYPDWLKLDAILDDKSVDLVVTNHAYMENVVNYNRRVVQTQLSRLREPVDKSLWAAADSGPAIINAYYSLLDNGIVIPAGILQPPFYHADMPWYSNLGGVGVVLGHEITHGFDSTGRLIDQHGNIENWWSSSSIQGFVDAASCLVNQYSGFVMPENGELVDGDMTEAENIADNGGLREAYNAYKADTPSVQNRLPGLEDLTNDQLFFLSYSQLWCSVISREGADLEKYQAHSPGQFRVIGPLQNNEYFHSAFGCSSRDYMYRSQFSRCKVWY